ncbi:hypothetical protein BKA67DRAFT_677185 [Truncatella angustata]|uniref:RING-type domain-containing protein n=1 Tax=Truncatella angustata TaxID=152316 RepID=A0A9P8ZZ44_9PEZI|nr:uncharacterized protein BKA67DRAFT_677185 [Truncatella angustata]KAH6654666.1 hypothetical protein BKA67DRAFT_677185 [Truncatella angustata]KAH8196935.1 hypothetical protein TruAng_008892 [Truncatella angustata]
MQIKTFKIGRSIVGKIPYLDEPMNPSRSVRDSSPRGARAVRAEPGISPRARSTSPFQAGLVPFPGSQAVADSAVEQYRAPAVGPPRTTRAQLHRQEEMPRRQRTRSSRASSSSSNSSGSSSSSSRSSSSSSSSSSNRSSRGPSHAGGACIPPRHALDIESLMQSLDELWLPDPAVSIDDDHECVPAYDDRENCFKDPKVTFLIDRPQNITCCLCYETKLQMKPSADSPRSDADTVILPCSHAFCRGCLDRWVEDHQSCPSCRLRLVRDCGHAIEPRVIARDTIMALPPVLDTTVDQGRHISRRCWTCRVRDQAGNFARVVKRYRRCRRELAKCAAAGDDDGDDGGRAQEAKAAYDKAKKDFGQFSKNTTYENSMFVHSYW